MSKVTLCIMALNDAELLDSCLLYHKSFVDDIIVLDGFSQDNTVEVAKMHGAKVFQRPPCDVVGGSGSYGDDQNFLKDLAETPWVLFVDCDERMDEQFLRNLHIYIAEESPARLQGVVAFKFSRNNVDELGTWPDYQIRLFLKDQCRWKGRVDDIVVDIATGKPIDSSDFNPRKSQTLDNHPITHLARPIDRTLATQERWIKLRKIDGK